MSKFCPRPKQGMPPKKTRQPIKRSQKPLKRSGIRPKPRKPTGEIVAMRAAYARDRGICRVTGKPIEFSPSCMMHVVGKGARPDLRLNIDNILTVVYRFHFLYDNSSKEKTLKEFPGSEWVWELKQKMKEIR